MEFKKLSMQVIGMQHILSFLYHIFVLFLNQFYVSLVFYSIFFNPVGKNHVFLQEFVLG